MRRLRLLAFVALVAACGSSSSGGGGGGGSGGSAGGGSGGSAGGGTGGGVAGGAGGGNGGGSAVDAGADAGVDAGFDAGLAVDAGADAGTDAGMIPFEVEPNNGAAAGQLDSITFPGAKQGAVGAANDVDIFLVSLTAGQQVRWTAAAQGSALAPHLSITESQNTVPILAARGVAGGAVSLEQLVLKTASYAIIVRDARNVPSTTSQNVGSPQHAYVVGSVASTRAPVQVAVPSTTNGTLPTRFASALFKFNVASAAMVTVNVLAKGKAPSSDLDTRLTLFNATTNTWLGTNDDLSGSNTDSRLTGTLPAGDYFAVVDNLLETANDLTFQLVVSSP